MKDIGIKFKEAREFIGIDEEEAANDMDITIAQLENLEDGNANAFRDMFFLKELIRKYAKYLNLDEDDLVDDYNEFMFNFTSKIPVAEIEKKVSEINNLEAKESSKKVVSPYTQFTKENKGKKIGLTVLFIVLLLAFTIFVTYFIKQKVNNNDFVGLNILKGVNIYECSK